MFDTLIKTTNLLEEILGTWKLCSYKVFTMSGTTLYPYSESPVGQLLYTKEGFMSAQIMNPNRPKYETVGLESDSDLRKLYNGYISYFGRFSICEKNCSIIHHVEGALQTWILGTPQERFVKLENDFLTLRADLSSGRNTRTHEILWKRVAIKGFSKEK